MKIQTLTISSGRKIPNPAVDFASMNSHVTITATLDEGDQAGLVAEELQHFADAIVETHVSELYEKHRPQPRPAKAQTATETKAAALAAKHGGKVVQ